jgi:tetratricopeptide (TPR) repeat protein
LARTYLKAKRFDEAVSTLEKALAVSSADPELDNMLSNAKLAAFDMLIEERKKRGEDYVSVQAERDLFELDDLTERVERYPNDAHLRYLLGNLMVKNNRYEDAIRHLQISQKSPKDRIESLYLLAKCFIAKGQTDLGIMQLETALSQLPTMNELKKKVIYQLGLCAEDAGEDEKAYAYYRDVYAADIGFADLNERMMVLDKMIKKRKAESNR